MNISQHSCIPIGRTLDRLYINSSGSYVENQNIKSTDLSICFANLWRIFSITMPTSSWVALKTFNPYSTTLQILDGIASTELGSTISSQRSISMDDFIRIIGFYV